jgi:hypothetical protein
MSQLSLASKLGIHAAKKRRGDAALASSNGGATVSSTRRATSSSLPSDRAGGGSEPDAAATRTEGELKALLALKQHFSKIAKDLKIGVGTSPDASSRAQTDAYHAWCVRFKIELAGNGLSDVIEREGDRSVLQTARQQAVWEMISRCVPDTVLPAIAVSSSVHTGYEAWRLLRRHYLGDEQTFLQGLENRFARIVWAENEEFPAFENRFSQVVAELTAAGQGKTDHALKSTLMAAVEQSGKKDAHGASVFSRLRIVDLVKRSASFEEWLAHLRVEAQQIRDALADQDMAAKRRGVVRTHAGETRTVETVPISFVAPSSSSSRPFVAPQVTRRAAGQACFLMASTGSCRYGATCRFSHDPAVLRSASQGRTNTRPLSRPGEPCRLHQAGRCRFGSSCKFSHAHPGNSANPGFGPSSQPPAAARTGAETISVQQLYPSFSSWQLEANPSHSQA